VYNVQVDPKKKFRALKCGLDLTSSGQTPAEAANVNTFMGLDFRIRVPQRATSFFKRVITKYLLKEYFPTKLLI